MRKVTSGSRNYYPVHYRKHLIHHALQNITTGNSKKINILQAISMISLAWNQVKAETIKNCFMKGGFIEPKLNECNVSDENDINESDDETVIMDEEDWNLLRADITFEEYVNCDTDIITSELFTMDELIENTLPEANLSDDEEDCEEVIPPSFKDAMDCIEKLRNYFVCQNTSEKTFNELNSIQNAVLKTHRQSVRQTSITDFFSR